MKRSVMSTVAILALLTLTTLGASGCIPYADSSAGAYSRFGGGGHDRD